MLNIFETPPSSAQKNMKTDEKLLQELHLVSDPILHLYEWETNAITYGYFIQPEKVLNLKKVKEYQIDLARRSTGGGVVFHQADYAFSFLLPSTSIYFSLNTLENYQFVNNIVLKAIQNVMKNNEISLIQEDSPLTHMQMKNFCMARPTKYDVLLNHRKIAGAAQRKTKSGYLHQGTISIAMPKEKVLRDLLLHDEIYTAMMNNSFYLFEKNWTQTDLQQLRRKIKQALIESFKMELSNYETCN